MNNLERSNSFRERNSIRVPSQTLQSHIMQSQINVKNQFKLFWIIGIICMIALIIGAGMMGNPNTVHFVSYAVIIFGGLYGLSSILNSKLFFGNENINALYVMGNTIMEKYEPYYKYLSPNVKWNLTDEYTWTPFVVAYYIPIILGTLCGLYAIHIDDDTNILPLIIAAGVSQLYIVITVLKMLMAHFVAYLVSCVNIINESNELEYKRTFMHTLAVLSFITTEILFGYVLSELKMDEDYVRGIITITLHMLLNFIFWVEMCRFYKYETGTERGTFRCFYEDGHNANEDHDTKENRAQFYLLFKFVEFNDKRSKSVNWYFGTGNSGKTWIAFSYLIFPVLCQVMAYILYEITNDTTIYVSVVNLSHLFFGFAILKSILYGGYKGCEIFVELCKNKCQFQQNPPLANADGENNSQEGNRDSAVKYFDQL